MQIEGFRLAWTGQGLLRGTVVISEEEGRRLDVEGNISEEEERRLDVEGTSTDKSTVLGEATESEVNDAVSVLFLAVESFSSLSTCTWMILAFLGKEDSSTKRFFLFSVLSGTRVRTILASGKVAARAI